MERRSTLLLAIVFSVAIWLIVARELMAGVRALPELGRRAPIGASAARFYRDVAPAHRAVFEP